MARFRKMKPLVRDILGRESVQDMLDGLAEFETREIVGPLFSMLLNPEELIRWRAVTGLGATVARMAEVRAEDARVVMRRFMWHMNEESGNVGWGIPEAMGESMARSPRMAEEFHKKLASYVQQCPDCAIGDDNFLDHPPLRQGVYWGLGRLAEAHPRYLGHAAADMARLLDEEESVQAKALLCRLAGVAGIAQAADGLREYAEREDAVDVYLAGSMVTTTLGALAREALAALDENKE